MRSPPAFLKGMHKSAIRVALTEFQQAGRDETRRCRAWKLFLLIPRMLIHTRTLRIVPERST